MRNQTTRTASIVDVPTSMAQHRWLNIYSTLKTTKPPKTPKIPGRQKFPSNKNFRNNQNKNPINYNLFSQSHIQFLLNNL